MQALNNIRGELNALADIERASATARFFKTGPGEYGEGDVFIGVSVPQIRSVVKRFEAALTIAETEALLHSKVHEERLAALLILVAKFNRANGLEQSEIYHCYLRNTAWVNNWDLVDSSAHLIVGPYLHTRDKSVLDTLAVSDSLWERRIAMLSTFHYIKYHEFTDALRIATLLIDDRHDLIHKAVGWMLREIGKRDVTVLENFLDEHQTKMPRTCLRYAIERFEPEVRNAYFSGKD